MIKLRNCENFLMMRARLQSSAPPSASENGFSLLEVIIIVAMIGLLLTPFIIQYNAKMKRDKITSTRTNAEVAVKALEKYSLKYGHYPKPANPALASNARVVISGIEYGSGDAQPNEFNGATAYPACPANPALPQTSVCQTAGTIDTLADGDTLPDPIYVGSLPFADIGLNESQSIDAFGNKIRYVVTAYQTRVPPPNFDRSIGVIRLEDDMGVPDPTSNGTLHFILISHGESGRGAYTLAGTQYRPCGADTLRRDFENCDYDGVFDDGVLTYTYTDQDGDVQTSREPTMQFGETANAYNNYVFPYAGSGINDWVAVPAPSTDDIGTLNVNAVLVNSTLSDDSVRVQVGGDVRADRVYTDRICGTTINNFCVQPISIGRDTAPAVRPSLNTDADSSGIRCAAFSAMTGIVSGGEDCGALKSKNLGTFVLTPCPAGQFPNGITNTGQRTCSAP